MTEEDLFYTPGSIHNPNRPTFERNPAGKIVVETTVCPIDEQTDVVSAVLVLGEYYPLEVCGASEGGYRTVADYEPQEIKDFIKKWRKKAKALNVPFEIGKGVEEE